MAQIWTISGQLPLKKFCENSKHYHYEPTRMVKMKKTEPNFGEDVELQNSHALLFGV